MKRQIITLAGKFVMMAAFVFATSPCLGKIYEPDLPLSLTMKQ